MVGQGLTIYKLGRLASPNVVIKDLGLGVTGAKAPRARELLDVTPAVMRDQILAFRSPSASLCRPRVTAARSAG